MHCLNVGPEAACYDGALQDNLRLCLKDYGSSVSGYHKLQVQVPGGRKEDLVTVLCVGLAVKQGDEPLVCDDCRAMGAEAASWPAQHRAARNLFDASRRGKCTPFACNLR